MKINLSGYKKKGQKSKTMRKCEECNSRVEAVNCESQDQEKHCHLNCALKNKAINKKEWNVNFELHKESNLPVFSYIEKGTIADSAEEISLKLKKILDETPNLEGMETEDSLLGLEEKEVKGEKKLDRENPKVKEFLKNVTEKVEKAIKLKFENDKIEIEEDEVKNTGGRIQLLYGEIKEKKSSLKKSKATKRTKSKARGDKKDNKVSENSANKNSNKKDQKINETLSNLLRSLSLVNKVFLITTANYILGNY